jgi:thiamine-phosphate pyrophosphorylase
MLVTNRAVAGGEDALVKKAGLAVEGGADWVQVREKDMGVADLVRLVRRIVQVARGRAKVVVNGPLQAAIEGGADGVHLPESADMVRHHGMIVGRSVHEPAAASVAEEEGADYIVAGPVFATPTHAGVNPLGLGLITDIAERVAIPVVAIGGINAHRAAGVIVTGASGVAVVRAILESPDPRREARVLREAMEGAKGL